MSELKPSNNPKSSRFVKIGEASEILGVSIDTLRRWEKAGKIETIRTPGGTRLYKVKTLEKIQQKKSGRSVKKTATPVVLPISENPTNSAFVTPLPETTISAEDVTGASSTYSENEGLKMVDTFSGNEETHTTSPDTSLEQLDTLITKDSSSISLTDYIGKYHGWEAQLPVIEPSTFQPTDHSSSTSENKQNYTNLASNSTEIYAKANSFDKEASKSDRSEIYADLASNTSSLNDTSFGTLTNNDVHLKDDKKHSARGFRGHTLPAYLRPDSFKNRKVIGGFLTLLILFVFSLNMFSGKNGSFLSFSFTSPFTKPDDSSQVLAESTIAQLNKYLEVNADIAITGNLAVEGEGIFREAVTAPNLVYGLVAGTNVTISGDPQNPTISATVTGIATESDTLATVTGRGAATTTPLQLNGGVSTTNLTIANALSLGNLSSDPSSSTNGSIYYNTSSNRFRCYVNGSWSDCDTDTDTVGSSFDSIELAGDSGTNETLEDGDVLSIEGGNGITTAVSADDTLTVTVDTGNGLTFSSSQLTLQLISSGITSTTSSSSGLELTSDGLSLIRGCGNGELLKWTSATSTWDCSTDTGGGGGGVVNIQENDGVAPGASYTSIGTLDFALADFTLTESPAGEVNVSIDYTSSNILRSDQDETITGNWSMNGTVAFGSTTTFQANDITDAEVSNTLTASIFVGSGSSTNAVDLGTAEVAGTLTVDNGGTGATSLSGLLIGNGTSPFTATTTSAGIIGIISDETGSGSLVFSNSPTFTTPSLGAATATTIDTGNGANELYAMDQNVRTTDGVTFTTINTGQGANELYDMDQNVQTTDSVTFANLTLANTGALRTSTSNGNTALLQAYDVDGATYTTFGTLTAGNTPTFDLASSTTIGSNIIVSSSNVGTYATTAVTAGAGLTGGGTTGALTLNIGSSSTITVNANDIAVTADSIGDTELAFNTGQNLTTTSAVTFSTVDTGQGANELYDMDQNVTQASNVTFADITANGNLVFGSDSADLLTINAVLQGTTPFVFEGSAPDGNETTFNITNPTTDNTITFPDLGGTVILSGHTFTGDVSATLDTDGSTALTIQADSVALATDTTGNYVATISGSSQIGVSGSGSENAGVSLSLTANSVDASHLASTLTFADGDYLDLSAIVHDDTALQGFRLPNAASATPSSPVSGEGQIAYDATGNNIIFYNGSSWQTLATSGSAGDITQVGDETDGTAFTGNNDGNTLTFEGTVNDGNDIAVTAVNPAGSITLTLPDIGTNGTFALLQGTQTFTGAKTFDDLTVADTNVSFSGASTTFTTTGNFTITPGGSVLIGDGGDTLQINTSDWDISTTGAITNATYEGLVISTTTGTFTLANGKTLTANNTLTFDGTDGTTFTFPGTSGTVVTTDGTQTLTNKTLTTPRVADLGYIADSNGNELLVFDSATSAVNYFQLTNSATGNGLALTATGDDTNVDLSIDAKGSGVINIGNTSTGNILLGGGSSSTGCTITNSNGNLACSGAVSGSNLSGTNTGDQNIFQTIAVSGESDVVTDSTTDTLTLAAGTGISISTNATSDTITITATGSSGDISAVGDVITGDAFTNLSGGTSNGNALYFEGTSADGNDILLTAADPGSDFTITLPALTGTVALLEGAQTFTGTKTFDDVIVSDTNVSFSGASTTFTTTGGFTLTPGGAVVFGDGGDNLSINSNDWDISTSGAITNATYEGLTISTTTGTLTIANGKTLTANNSLTFDGTDGTTFTFPGTTGTVVTTAATQTLSNKTFSSDINFLDADTTSYAIAGADASTATGAAGDLTLRAGNGGATSGNGGNLILAAGTVTSGTPGYFAVQTGGSERFRIENDGDLFFEKGSNDLTLAFTAPTGASRTLTVPALSADDELCIKGVSNCFGSGTGGVSATGTQNANEIAFFTADDVIDGTANFTWNDSTNAFGLTGTIAQTYAPAGTVGSATANQIALTAGIDATDQTLTGLLINADTNSNADAGDILYGINIADITASSATETALRIGNNFDNDIIFEKGSSTDVILRVTAASGGDRILTIPALSANVDICHTGGNCAGVGGVGDIQSVGDVTSGDAFANLTGGTSNGNSLYFEGSTADGNDILLTADDPGSDFTITLPALTGTVLLGGANNSLASSTTFTTAASNTAIFNAPTAALGLLDLNISTSTSDARGLDIAFSSTADAGNDTIYGGYIGTTIDSDAGGVDTGYGLYINVDNDDANSSITGLYVDADGDNGGTGSEFAAVFMDGNVGIGVADPDERLEIDGAIHLAQIAAPGVTTDKFYNNGGTLYWGSNYVCVQGGACASSGTVVAADTDVANQIPYFTADDAIDGDNSFTFIPGTTTGNTLSLSNASLSSGTLFNFSSTSNSAADTAWVAGLMAINNNQGTTAVSTGSIYGVNIAFNQNTSIAGNTESAMRVGITQNNSASTDQTVSSILTLENDDTVTGNQITASRGLNIDGANVTDGIYFNGTFGTNLINSSTGNFVVTQAGALTATTINTGQGDNELYDMNQNVQTTDAVTFLTVDTGQGANELFDMDQNVLTTSNVTFADFTSNGNVILGSDATDTITINGVLQGTSPLVFEGSSADANEITFSITNPTGARTQTFQDNSGVVALGTAGNTIFFTTTGATNVTLPTSGTLISQAYQTVQEEGSGLTQRSTINFIGSGITCADNGGSTRTDCTVAAGAGANIFETFDAPAGTDPVADSATDTLALAVTGTNLSITGNSASDTITFDISESTLAGSGLSANSDALDVNVSNGLEINSDNVRVNQDYNFAWTNSHGWTLADTEDLTIGSTITSTNANDVFAINLTNQTSSGTQRGIAITNVNDAANAVTESLIFLDNAETTASTVTDAILITSSGVDGGVVDAIDVSAGNITNAINIGANAIAGTNFSVTGAGALTALTVNTGNGDYELFAMDQNVRTSDAVTFTTVDTGQGANELYDMDQNVLTTSNVTFADFTSNGNLVLGSDAADTLTVNAIIQGTSPFVFEGSSADANELTFSITNPTGTRTQTFQDNSGVVALGTAGNTIFFTTTGATNVTLPTSGTLISQAYTTVADEGTPLTQRASLNFIGSGVSCADNGGSTRTDCTISTGAGANLFETINAPSGSDPVADSATDTLNLAVTGTNLSITGDSSSDTLTFDLSESTLAGSALVANGDALDLAVSNGLEINSDAVRVNQDFNFAWTNSHGWTLADTEDLTIGSTITSTNSNDVFAINVTNQTSSGTQRGIAVINANDAANASTEALIFLDNAETTASTVADAILITSSGVADGIVDAIDVSAANITNGINLGSNNLILAGDTINDFTGNGLTVSTNALTIALQASANGASATNSSGSGLEVLSGGLTLLQGCGDGEVLAWDETNDIWECTAVSGIGGVGDITAVGSITSGDAFADASADDDWLGLGGSAGRIGFDDLATDEVDIFNATLDLNTGLISNIGDANTDFTSGGGLTLAGTFVANGSVTIGNAGTDQLTITSEILGASPLIFEGASDDGSYLTFAVTDPTGARTQTFQDNSGVVALGTAGNTIFFTTTGATNVTLPTSGTLISQAYQTIQEEGSGLTQRSTVNFIGSGITCADNGGSSRTDCTIAAGAGANIFETINAPAGTDPVADAATDTLNLAVTGTNLSITGDSSSDTLTFDISESTLAGSGLAANSDALDVNVSNGLEINSDNVRVNQDYNFAWTNSHGWTLADTEDLTIGSTITGTNANDVFSVNITNQTSSGTQRGLVFVNTNDAANAATESLIFLDNAETTASTVTDAILITSSGVDGGIVDAIDVSDGNITNAINIGANAIAGSNFSVTGAGAITGITLNTGQGDNELYDMDQNVQTTDGVTFATVDTGQGANELYDMDQNVLTTSDVVFNTVSLESAGVRISGDDDGAITFLGLGDGSDEDLTLNLDDTSNTGVFSSSTGLNALTFTNMALTAATDETINGLDISAGSISDVAGYTQSTGTFTLTAADASSINLSAVNVSGTGEGFFLPQTTSCASGTANGQICWDNDTFALYVGNGTTVTLIGGSGGGDITAVGSMTSGDAFVDASADDDWLGLGGSAGRIAFDDLATDEVDILDATLDLNGNLITNIGDTGTDFTSGGGLTLAGTFVANGSVTIGNAGTDQLTITSEILGASPLIFEGASDDGSYLTFAVTDPTGARTQTFQDNSGVVALGTAGNTIFFTTSGATNVTLPTTGTLLSDGTTLFTLDGDDATTETITSGNTLLIAGGTNGIDTDVSATDTITLNLDTTEIGDTTFGNNGAASYTWTFDVSGTDTTMAWGNGAATYSGDLTVSGGDITGANSESIDIGEGSNGVFNFLIDGTTSATQISANGITSLGNVAHSIVNNSGALNIDSNSTGAINLGTSSNAKTITVGNATGATALAFNSGTGSQTFTSQVATGTTTTSGFVFDATAINSGTGLYLTSDSITTGKLSQIATTGNTLTSGTLSDIRTTSTALTGSAGTGSLLNLDWTPGSATTATGDLFALNIGANGTTTGNLFNILDSGSSIFSVSESALTSSLPVNFTGAGDVSIANDIQFTNPTASFIKSYAGITFQPGDPFGSSNLTISPYNEGSVYIPSNVATAYGLDIDANLLSTGRAVDISSTSTAGGASGSSYLLYLDRSGANANSSHTSYGLYSSVTTTGTSDQSYGGYFTATASQNATALYALATSGATSVYSINAGLGSGTDAAIYVNAPSNFSIGTANGVQIDLASNITTSSSGTVNGISINNDTASLSSGTGTFRGIYANHTGSLTTTSTGTINHYGLDVVIPTLTQTSGTLTAYGVNVSTSTSVTTGGTQYGLNVNATGVGAGSLTGLNISNITGGSGTEYGIGIGSGWDTDINATTSLEIGIGGTNELFLDGDDFSPFTSDGNSLGDSDNMWSDLFLASGSVINFNNGDVTLTHSANALAFTGGNIGIGGDATPDAQLEIGDGTDEIQFSSVGDITFIDADGTASITGPAGGALTVAAGASQALTLTANGSSTWSTSAGNLTISASANAANLTVTAGDTLASALANGNDLELASEDDIILSANTGGLIRLYSNGSALDCSGSGNGGALTTNSTGDIVCSADDGGSGSTPNFDDVYAESVSDGNLTMEIDDTGGLIYNMTTTGDFVLQDNGSAIATFGDDGIITFAPGALTSGSDFIVNQAAGTNTQITALAAPTVDLLALSNAGQGTTTAGVAGLSLAFVTGDGSDVTNYGINLNLTSGGTGAGDVLNGFNLALTGTSGTERGINFADNNFDLDINATTDLTFGIGGTSELSLTGTNFAPTTASGNTLGSATNEWAQLFLGDDAGVSFGLDQDFALLYDEATDDRLELTATNKEFNIALGNQDVVISGSAEGTAALTITAGDLTLSDGDLSIASGQILGASSAVIDVGVTNSGDVTITGDILPTANDTYDLGSNSLRFKDLYLGGETLHIGTSTTDEGTISYNTSTNVLNFGTDSTTNGDIAFNTDDLFIDKSTGFVGIGSSAPTSQLFASASDVNTYSNTNILTLAHSVIDTGGIDTNTKLLLHQNGVDASTTFTDSGNTVHTVTANGNAQLDTTIKKYGSAAGQFDGTGDYLSIADNDDFDFGSGDFTIDTWIYLDAAPAAGFGTAIFSQDGGAATYSPISITLDTSRNVKVYASSTGSSWNIFNDTNFCSASSLLTTSAWHHFAFVRTGNDWKVFINGTQCGTTQSASGTLFNSTNSVYIGGQYQSSGGAGGLDGYLDDYRVSKGVARWTADFTTPPSEYGSTYGEAGIASSLLFQNENDSGNMISSGQISSIMTTVTDGSEVGELAFYTANNSGTSIPPVERLRITGAGNVGIGDTSADAKFEVLATTEQMRLTHTDGTKDARFTVDTNGMLTIDTSTDGTAGSVYLTDDLYVGASSETLAAAGFAADGNDGFISGMFGVEGVIYTDGGLDVSNSAFVVSSAGAITASTGYTQASGTFSLTAADSSVINLSAVNVSGTGEGLFLPQTTSCSSGTAEGQICWDSDTEALYIGTGATALLIGGVGGGDITAVGSMVSGDAFADSSADDDWLGLGGSAGRIEFDDQGTDEVNILDANVGIGDSTPDGLFDIDSSATTTNIFGITQTGSFTGTGSSSVAHFSSAATSGTILNIDAGSITSGKALSITGPTASGVTSTFINIATDVAGSGTAFNLNPDFSGTSGTQYGFRMNGTDSSANNTSDIGIDSTLAITANSTKSAWGTLSTVTSTSNTGTQTLYGGEFITDHGAAFTGAGAKILYGISAAARNDGYTDDSSSTSNIYGASIGAWGNTGGTQTVYGISVGAFGGDTGYGLYLADGTSTTSYGVYQSAASDSNYFAGNFGIGTDTTPDNLFEVENSAALSTDLVSLVASGATTTSGVDGLSVAFTTGDGSNPTNNGINVSLTSGGTASGDILNGLNLSLTGTSGSEYGINFADNNFDLDVNAVTDFTVGIGATSAMQVSSTGITSLGNVAHSIVNSGGALNIDSNSTGAINIGTAANAKTITIGNATGATALAFNSGTGSQTFTSQVATGTTTTSGFVFDATAINSGTGAYFTSDSITTGKLAQFATTGNTFTSGTLSDIRTTSTALTGTAGTGSLLNLDWTPGSSTTATGDLFALNIGANGTTTGNLFNILDSGSSIFSVSETAVTTSLPANFTASGDVSVAYDINFTNPTASYLKSAAPLYLVAGETFNSSNLTLQTYNQGSIVFDTANTTSTALNLTNSTLTTGTALNIAISGSSQTTASGLKITQSGTTTGFTGNFVDITGSSTTGTGNLVNLTAVNTTNGSAMNINTNALTTGVGLSIAHTTSAITTGSLLKITSSSTDLLATNGLVSIAASGAFTSTSNVGLLNISASNASQVSGTALNVVQTGVSTGYTGNFVNFTGSSTTGTGNLLNLTSVNTTNGAALNISAASVTTGKALNIAGSTGTGVTGNFSQIATDVGSAGAAFGIVPDFSGAGVTGYGINIQGTDTTSSNNTDVFYNAYIRATGNAAKSIYGIQTDIQSNSTTADYIYGARFIPGTTGAISSGIRQTIGAYGSPSATGNNSGGTMQLMGFYSNPTYSASADTSGAQSELYGLYVSSSMSLTTGGNGHQYGLYVTDMTSTTTGSTDKYGIYVAAQTGADANYGGYFGSAVGIGDLTPDGLLDLDSSSTSTNIFGITQTGSFTGTGSSSVGYISSAATTGDVLTISATALTSGSGLVLTGASGTGVTDALLKLSGNIGATGTGNSGLFNSTGTINTSTSTTGVNAYLSTTNAPTGTANTAYGLYNVVTDNTTLDNSVLGISTTVSSTNNSAKTLYGVTGTTNSTSTTADNMYAGLFSTTSTGTITTGSRNIMGVRTTPSSASSASGGTTNVYGIYAQVTGTVAAGGSVNNYGLYAANATANATGTSANYGLYVEAQSGADTNHAIYTAGGTVQFTCTTNGTTWTTSQVNPSCADYAEVYDTDDYSLEEGDLVVIDANAAGRVAKSNTLYQNQIAGVYSTSPGMLIGDGQIISAGQAKALPENKVPVALAGKVPTKVSNENGPIYKGDLLTSSSVAGVAMKATRPGATVGKALEDFTGTGIGKILTFINVTFADPANTLANLSVDNTGALIVPNLKTQKLSLDELDVKTLTVNGTSLDLTQLTQVGTAIGNLNTATASLYDQFNTLAQAQNAQADSIASLQNDILGVQVQNASQSAELAEAKELGQQAVESVASLDDKVASTSSTLTSLSSKIDELLAQFGSDSSSESTESGSWTSQDDIALTNPAVMIATDSAEVNTLLVNSEATISGTLQAYDGIFQNSLKSFGETLLGNTTVAGDITVDGTLTIGSGNKVDAIGTLFIQGNPLADAIDFFNGIFTFDKEGTLVAPVIVAEQIKVKTGTSAGVGVIPAGQTEVAIFNELVATNSIINLTAETTTILPLAVSDKVSEAGFVVTIAKPASEDIKFNYLIVGQE